MSSRPIVSENDDTPMRFLRSNRRTFVRKPFEILYVSRVMVFDSPILYSMEAIQILTFCILCYKGPQGAAENGDIVR
jgi:hypothetical protein